MSTEISSAFDQVIINPDLHEISCLLNSATATANREATRFKINSNSFVKEFSKKVLADECGIESRSQSGYGRRNYASVGVAWFVDDLRRKHVRVVGARVGFGYGSLNFSGDIPLLAVYPKIPYHYEACGKGKGRKLVLTCRLCQAKASTDYGEWAGEHCMRCFERQQYFEDTGFYNAVGKF